MQVRIFVPDIECESCVKLITKRLHKKDGVEQLTFTSEAVVVDYNADLVTIPDLINTIKELNFRASTQPFERKNFKERFKHLRENKGKYETELKVLSYSFQLFVILLGFEVIVYLLFLQDIPNFLANYMWWIIYLNISVATLTMAVWHVYSYKYKMTCMLGMMIAMTVGMQTGMMVGAVLGATNGFFVGALVGMLLATSVGAITGKGCGIMGVLEGMMAGIMGGTMGAMISVMMFSDNILLFMPVYMLLNVIILWGLSYLLYEEVVEDNEHTKPNHISFTTALAAGVMVNFVLLTIMIYGPKSAFIGF